MFSWQTYNALFIVRCFTKFLVQNNKEADLIRHIETKGELFYVLLVFISMVSEKLCLNFPRNQTQELYLPV